VSDGLWDDLFISRNNDYYMGDSQGTNSPTAVIMTTVWVIPSGTNSPTSEIMITVWVISYGTNSPTAEIMITMWAIP
jgi:methylglyoxal synthase